MLKKFLIFLLLTIFIFANINKDINSNKKNIFVLKIVGLKILDKDELAKDIGAKKEGFLKTKYLISQKFLKVINESIKNFMQSYGFFNYKIKIKKYNKVVKLIINEGKPIRISDIQIDSDFNIKNLITLKRGEIFSPKKFLEIKDNIIKKLMEDGYCQYKLNTKAYVDLKKYSAKLKYFLRKNKICYFGKIKIDKKPKNISKSIIISRIKFRRGDRFSTKKIEESYIALNKLNIFANINIIYNLDKNRSIVDTSISLDKREKLKRIEFAIGYDTILGTRLKAYWENRDMFKNATKISINTEFSKKNKNFDTTLFAPALFKLNKQYLDFYFTIGAIHQDTNAYKKQSFFINSYFLYNYKKFDIKTGIGIENLDITLKENSSFIIGGIFNMIYPYIEAIYDNRDSKLDPKKGEYFKVYWEYGLSSSKEGGVQYLKYFIEGRYIKTFNNLTLSSVAKFGFIKNFSGKLPASKLFYGGGEFSNRAYGKNSVGLITSNKSYKDIGGKVFFNLQLEANYKLYKKLYGALFFDTTIISDKMINLNSKRLDTLGLGIRYKTPIGPIKIDFGFNMHHFKSNAISIMLGQSF